MIANLSRNEVKYQNTYLGTEVSFNAFQFLENTKNCETSTYYNYNVSDELLDTLKEAYVPKNPFENDDDSDADPNYTLPTDQSDDDYDQEMEEMARNLEFNLDNEINTNHNHDSENIITERHKPSTSKSAMKELQMKRNTGQAYVSTSGRIVVARECKPLQKCRKRCDTKITFEKQKKIFQQYWDLTSYNLRCAFFLD